MLRPAAEKAVRFSVDEVERMISAGVFAARAGKIELFEGAFYEMSPGSELHDNLIRALTTWSVRQQVEDQFEVSVQLGLRLMNTESLLEPDLFWVRAGETARPTVDVVPLVVEVAVSSLQHDRVVKGRLYALDGLQEYWIVNAEQQRIEVRRNASGDQFLDTFQVASGDSLSPLCLPSARLDVEWLFRTSGA